MNKKSKAIKLALRISSGTITILWNVIFYTLVVMLIVSVSKSGYEFTYQIYGPVSVDEQPGRDVLFQVKKGESSMEISQKLELNKLIKDKKAFAVKSKLKKSNIMPGTYELNSSMTYDEILSTITDYSASIIKVDIEETEEEIQEETQEETEKAEE